MDQTRLLLDLTTWTVEVLFYASAVFGIVYGFAYAWWETSTGWAIFIFPLGGLFSSLKAMLLVWGVQIVHFTKDGQAHGTTLWLIVTWVSLAGPVFLGLSIIILGVLSVIHVRSEPAQVLVPSKLARKILRFGKHDREAAAIPLQRR